MILCISYLLSLKTAVAVLFKNQIIMLLHATLEIKLLNFRSTFYFSFFVLLGA